MPSLVATTSADARKTFMPKHSAQFSFSSDAAVRKQMESHIINQMNTSTSGWTEC